MSIDYLILIDRRLRYDDETGEIRWRVRPRTNLRAGTVAGNFRPDGTIMIGIKGRYFAAQDIAWFLGHGEWPPSRVLHRNGVRCDNWLDNLELESDVLTASSPLPSSHPAA
jgi:hypothetical protein